MIACRFLLRSSFATLAASWIAAVTGESSVPENLDHLILGCRDLDEGIDFLEKLSGYRAAFGGSHPGRGTRNAILKLGPHSYLEILAPDPLQNELAWQQKVASLLEPLLVGYAIHQEHLEALAAALRHKGIPCKGPSTGSRARPDGQILRWQTLFYQDDRESLLPFYIDWDERSPHPSSDAPGALSLLSFARTGHLLEESTPPTGKHKVFLSHEPVQLRARLRGIHGEFELLSKSIPSESWAH